MTLRNIKKIIEGGFVLKLHGSLVDWESLKAGMENRKLSPAQRRRLKLSKMNTQMKAYWSKAVVWVNDGKTHPNRIINQPFAHGRMALFHEVGFCVLCVFNSFNINLRVCVCVLGYVEVSLTVL